MREVTSSSAVTGVNNFVLPDWAKDSNQHTDGRFFDEKLTATQILDRNIAVIHQYINLLNTGSKEAINPSVFRLYSGFGGIGVGLMIKNPYDERLFSDLNMESTRQKLIGLHEAIKSCVHLDYKTVINQLADSEKTAYYTPQSISNVMASCVVDYMTQIHPIDNNTYLNFLEPAAGLGQFYSALLTIHPNLLHNDNVSASLVEMEFFASQFNSRLYVGEQDTRSHSYHMRFEDFATLMLTSNDGSLNNFSRREKFDLILSNIPFGDIRVVDKEYSNLLFKGSLAYQSQKTVHGYYFMRGIDLLEKNGVLAYITSTSIADGKSYANLRKHLLMEAKLLSVSRLPNTIFNNTKVNSDVLVFQKRERRLENENTLNDFEKRFLETKDFSLTSTNKNGKEKEHVFPINAVFLDDDGCLNNRVLGFEKVGFMNMKPTLTVTTEKETIEVAEHLNLVLRTDFSFALHQENEKEQLIINTQELEDMDLYLSMDDLYAIHDNDFQLPTEFLLYTTNDITDNTSLYELANNEYIETVNSICCDRELLPSERISQLRDLNIRNPQKVLLTYNQNKQKQSIDNMRRSVKSEIQSLKASIKDRSARLQKKTRTENQVLKEKDTKQSKEQQGMFGLDR